MLIDCDGCLVKGPACGGCVVSVMLGAPPAGVELDEAEQRALAVLADAGMVPQLRLVTAAAAGSGLAAVRDAGATAAPHSGPVTTPDSGATVVPVPMRRGGRSRARRIA